MFLIVLADGAAIVTGPYRPGSSKRGKLRFPHTPIQSSSQAPPPLVVVAGFTFVDDTRRQFSDLAT